MYARYETRATEETNPQRDTRRNSQENGKTYLDYLGPKESKSAPTT
jgi:hypothetical protein